MDAFKPYLAKVATGAALSQEESRAAFDALLSGAYNISTLAAFIVAGCGVPVAKHGNRAASSKSGAADVLSALDVTLGLAPAQLEACLESAGLCFMFAQAHHASMRHVAPFRVELGTRTIFNLLGPLSNPAGVKRQLLGVFSRAWMAPLAETLRALGSDRVWVVHGSDGLDELTTTGPSEVVALEGGEIRTFRVDPREVGLALAEPAHLKGGDPAHNAAALRAVLEGEKTPYRDIAVLNAAGSLVVAGAATDLAEGVAKAAEAVDSGAAKTALARLVRASKG